jgi:hypothetical protein
VFLCASRRENQIVYIETVLFWVIDEEGEDADGNGNGSTNIEGGRIGYDCYQH